MRSTVVTVGLIVAKTLAQNTDYEYVVVGSGPGGGTVAANLARAGHSVFLIEAGEDHGDSLLQQIPSLYAELPTTASRILIFIYSADPSAEDPTLSWEFFVDHYQDKEQAYKDTKYTWQKSDGDLYVGTSPPNGSKPLGILYPRAGTLGGCGNHNALNFALPPDSNWDHIANVTGDATWNADTMRRYFEGIENNQYVQINSSAAEGHGFGGWLAVSLKNILQL